jgi:hypothetical protein
MAQRILGIIDLIAGAFVILAAVGSGARRFGAILLVGGTCVLWARMVMTWNVVHVIHIRILIMRTLAIDIPNRMMVASVVLSAN